MTTNTEDLEPGSELDETLSLIDTLREDLLRIKAESVHRANRVGVLRNALVDLLDSPDVKALAKGPNFELGPADPFTRRAIRKAWRVARGEQ
jgi:hypothetical protein